MKEENTNESDRKQNGNDADSEIINFDVAAHHDFNAGAGIVQYRGQYVCITTQLECPDSSFACISSAESDDCSIYWHRCGNQCITFKKFGREKRKTGK